MQHTDGRVGQQRLPRTVTVGSVLAVCGVNLVILSYAVRISLPRTEVAPTSAQIAQGADLTVERSAVTAASRDPGREGVPGGAGVDEFDEFDDWTLEPIRVVNIFNLPSPQETQSQFAHHCTSCHGLEGRGDGPAAGHLLPGPRDFIGSPFRYSSPGEEPEHVLADLERTITHGVPRSAMPGFGGVLTESQIAGLARYVLEIREQGEQLAPTEQLVDVGMRPPITPELVARGKGLYTALSCHTCHGDSGHGDGMNAQSLVDFQGRPVRPADFTSGLFKTGQTPSDLCRTILRGIPGTPMVAYEAVLTQENEDGTFNTMDAWALVGYIRSLRSTPQPAGQPSGAQIIARQTPDEAMLTDPSHIAWLGVEPTMVTVKPLQQRQENTTCLEVRAVRSVDRMAICLEWQDETLDLSRRQELHPDAAAVVFGLGDKVPALPIGIGVEQHQSSDPVNIWHWKADRQYDATTGQRHAQITMDGWNQDGWYLFVPGSAAKVPEMSPGTGGIQGDALHTEPQSLRPQGAGAIENDPRLIDHSVLEANALGLGSVTWQPPHSQSAYATATWSGGMWRVVLLRSLASEDDMDVQFTSTQRVPIAFALWNGSKGDHAGIKLVSAWHWLVVAP